LLILERFAATQFNWRPSGGNESRPLAVYLTPDIQLYLAIGLFFAFVPFETLWRLRFDRPLMMMQQLGLSIVSLI
jgi:hypothetical protein